MRILNTVLKVGLSVLLCLSMMPISALAAQDVPPEKSSQAFNGVEGVTESEVIALTEPLPSVEPSPALSEGWRQCGTCEWKVETVDGDVRLTIRPLGDGRSGELGVWGAEYDISSDWCGNNAPWVEHALHREVGTVVVSPGVKAKTCRGMFSDFTGTKRMDLSGLDTTGVTSMEDMFFNCRNLESLDVSGLNTSSVRDMTRMFDGCRKMHSLDVSFFDTSLVKSMEEMFYACEELEALDVGNFDTLQVRNMRAMFCLCSSLESLDVGSFDTSNVNDMSNMFSGCNLLPKLDVSHFDTSKVTNMSCMFADCKSLSALDLGGFDTSKVEDMCMMFGGSGLKIIDLRSFDTSSSKSMEAMFSGCGNLESVDLSSFDTSYVVNMNRMFFDDEKLSSLDLSKFDTACVTSMESMFYNCTSLERLDVSSFNTRAVKSMESMFFNCNSLPVLDISSFSSTSLEDMSDMFRWMNEVETIYASDAFTASPVTYNYVFQNCFKLKGGAGTNYDPQQVGVSYARIDNPESGKPGYFTYKFHENPDVDPPALQKATVRYNTEFELEEADGEWIDKSVELTWGDALFDRNATEYNHDLARLGIALSMMTYSEGRLVQASPNIKTAVEDGVTLQTDYSKASQTTRDESYSLSTLKGMGFSEANIRNYYYRDEQRVRDNDTCAYTLAYKTIKRNGKTVPLVMVLVRGTAANAEWVSNANVSNSNQTLDDYHEGFLLAASEIEVSLRKLMKDCEAESLDMSDAVYFVTGHSRGAAVANLVGAWLSGSDQSKTNDVFTYTFAAPKTVSKAQMGSKSYQNVFNIVNSEDVVAYVPLSKWGYSRYGRTMTLPSRSNSSNYNSELFGMNEQFSSVTDGKSYKPYIDGTFSVTVTANLLYALCGNVDSLYKTFYAFEFESGVSKHTVASVLQSLLMAKYCGWDELSAKEKAASLAFAAIALKKGTKVTKDIVALIGGFGISAVAIAGGALAVNIGGHVGYAHTGETYLAWLMSTQNESAYKESNKSVLWACPVDVHVYDESGVLVASIENDVVDKSVMANGLAAYVTEEGEKYVHIPNDANYYFEVEATGEGTMDYVVSELDEDGEVERQVATYDVSLDLGKQYHGTLEAGSNEADSYALVDEAGEPVSVDSEYKASEASQSIVGVSVEGEGNAWGNAVVVPGAWATVHAEPLEGSSFKGWFEGDTLVSDQLDYRFRPEKDTDLVAVFADSADDPSEPSDNPQDPEDPSDDPANPSDKPGETTPPAEKDPNQGGDQNGSNNAGGFLGESNGSDKKQDEANLLGEDSKKNDSDSSSVESAKGATSKTALSQTGDQLPGAILASAFFALASLAGVMICLSWRRLRPAWRNGRHIKR